MSIVYQKGIHRKHILNNLKPIENTLTAFHEAIKQGAKYIECDCRLSKDNQIVIWHNDLITDYNKSRWTDKFKINKGMRISKMNYKKIAKIVLIDNSHISNFEELMAFIFTTNKSRYSNNQKVRLVLNIKTTETGIILANLINKYPHLLEYIELVISFSQNTLYHIYNVLNNDIAEKFKTAWVLDSLHYPEYVRIEGETMIDYNYINKFFESYIRYNLLFKNYHIGLYIQYNPGLTVNIINLIKNKMNYCNMRGYNILGIWNDSMLYNNSRYLDNTKLKLIDYFNYINVDK